MGRPSISFGMGYCAILAISVVMTVITRLFVPVWPIEMRREMEVLRHQWRLLGFEGLHVRMGINTGYCYVGNFGSRNRMTYTVVGKKPPLPLALNLPRPTIKF